MSQDDSTNLLQAADTTQQLCGKVNLITYFFKNKYILQNYNFTFYKINRQMPSWDFKYLKLKHCIMLKAGNYKFEFMESCAETDHYRSHKGNKLICYNFQSLVPSPKAVQLTGMKSAFKPQAVFTLSLQRTEPTSCQKNVRLWYMKAWC